MSPPHRRGSAAVELVLLIPLLALLLALLFTVGSAGISSLNVTIRARHEGWIAARQGASTSPLDFRDAAPDITTKSAVLPLAYSLPRLGLADATGQFSAMQGSWDHRELMKDEGIHFEEMRKVAAVNLPSVAGALPNFLAIFGAIANLQDGLDESLVTSLILTAMGIDPSILDINQKLEEAQESIDMIIKAAESAIKRLDKQLKDALDPDALRRKISRLRDAVDELKNP